MFFGLSFSFSPPVCLSVCLFVCLFTFDVPFKRLFSPNFLKSDVQHF